MSRRLIDLDEEDLARLIDERLAARLAITVAPPVPGSAALSAAACDQRFKLRRGTTARAIRAGHLPACTRPGKGGNDAFRIAQADAEHWFAAGCPAAVAMSGRQP